jgi:Leucine-rich repeat (LRR) protein
MALPSLRAVAFTLLHDTAQIFFFYVLISASVARGEINVPKCLDKELQDCQALTEVGKALGYKKWTSSTNWMSSKSICEWQGVSCDESSGRVKELDLAHNGIDGFLPAAIGNLTRLKALKMNGHRPASYSGCVDQNLHNSSLPMELFQLTELETLKLEYNCAGGTLPTEIGNLRSLTDLSLHSNFFHGTIPGSVARLSNLQTFKLGRNPFSGGFPNVSSLEKLNILSCNFCSLTGTIPNFFENFPEMEIIYFDGNGFTGSLPPSIGKLPKLWSFSFNINNLTGPIPSSYCELPLLTDCRIGADVNLTLYQAHYPWLQRVQGNRYDCDSLPKCAKNNGVCDKTKNCGPNGAWTKNHSGPCSPVKCR